MDNQGNREREENKGGSGDTGDNEGSSMTAVQGVYEQRRDTRAEETGGKRVEISKEEREFVIEQHKLHRVGPIALEKKIERIHEK